MSDLIVLPEDTEREKERRRSGEGLRSVRLTMLVVLGLLGAVLVIALDLVGS